MWSSECGMSERTMRVDICTAEDHDARDRLLAALVAVGASSDDDHDAPLGVGFNRFRVGGEVVSVFADAWGVDLAGPDDVIRRVLDAMADGD